MYTPLNFRTFSEIPKISENVDVYTRIFKVKPSGAKFDAKNVRNRTYRTIFWQEKKTWMKNVIFSWRNLDFNFVNLELFSAISELPGSFRTRLHVEHFVDR